MIILHYIIQNFFSCPSTLYIVLNFLKKKQNHEASRRRILRKRSGYNHDCQKHVLSVNFTLRLWNALAVGVPYTNIFALIFTNHFFRYKYFAILLPKHLLSVNVTLRLWNTLAAGVPYTNIFVFIFIHYFFRYIQYFSILLFIFCICSETHYLSIEV